MLVNRMPEITTYRSFPGSATLAKAADAYLEGFAGPPYFETDADRDGFLDRVRRYAARDGFRLVVAAEGDPSASSEARRVIGVGLAVIGHPGDWWRDQVAAGLPETDVEAWLGDAVLEVVDLTVIPAARGRGVGRAIHDALLSGVTTRTAVLTADTRATPARALYAGGGWQTLRDPFSVAGGEPVTLMVRRLD